MASSFVRGGLDWILGNISYQKSGQALEEAAWGMVVSPSLEMFKKCVDVAPQDMV